jgi:dTDP-L-oleandrosyltransferase
MERRHILVVNLAGAGHVLPSLGVIAELVDRGHRVTYVTNEKFAPTVESVGARALLYKSVFDDAHLPDLAAAADAETRVHLIHLAENEAILRPVERELADDPPDLLLYDVFPFIAARLLATRWDVPAVRMWPIFASTPVYSIFEELWRSHGFRHPAEVEPFRDRLTPLLAEFGVALSIRDFWAEIEELNVVFIPRSFQIAAESCDERYVFVGPGSAQQDPVDGWRPRDPGRPVLLVSLGTTFNEHPEFFQEFARAFDGTSWQVVLAVGEFLDPDVLGALPDNVEAHRWIPFPEVLRHASACVTQGTTGAVMEALSWGVPLLVVPDYATEAEPSADRVVELGLGHRLTLDQVVADTLADTVRRLVDDPEVRRRVDRMRQDIHEAGGAARAAEAIEGLLAARADTGQADTGRAGTGRATSLH